MATVIVLQKQYMSGSLDLTAKEQQLSIMHHQRGRYAISPPKRNSQT